MTPIPIEDAATTAARIVGTPVTMSVLKDKPGRRRTMRAHGPAGTAIVKTYASDRAPTVAARIAALADGPPEPCIPAVLYLDAGQRLVILSDVPGAPLRAAVLEDDRNACRAAGTALATWHRTWSRRTPDLRPHTVGRELAILGERGATDVDAALRRPWDCTTVVHRDLYEEQILTGPTVGLIDLDDTHLGPPELDIGNLLAHLALLGTRLGSDTRAAADALLDGYAADGGVLDPERLAQCEQLTRMRLGCIHGLPVEALRGQISPSGH